MLTEKELETLKELISKVEKLVNSYYEKNIKTDDTYGLNGWDLETNGVCIYSHYLDYNDDIEHQTTFVTLEELNKIYDNRDNNN